MQHLQEDLNDFNRSVPFQAQGHAEDVIFQLTLCLSTFTFCLVRNSQKQIVD